MENKKIFTSAFKDLLISAKPCHNRSECLGTMSKEQLKILALATRTYFGDTSEMIDVDFVNSKINNQILSFFHYGPRELVLSNFKTLSELCNAHLNYSESVANEIARTKDDLQNEILFLQSRGIIFLFKNGDEILPIVPDETVDFINQLLLADPELKTAGNMEDFHAYAAVLTALYGICPIKIFMDIWNRDFPNMQINDKNEFKEHLLNCHLVTTHFYLIGSSLISPNISTSEQRDQIKNQRQDIPVYMPDANEIKMHYRSYDYDDETKAFKSLRTFLIKKTKDAEYGEHITYEIFTILKLGIEFIKIEDILQEEFGIEFNKNEVQTFNKLILSATTTCHFWTKWGNTAMFNLSNLINNAKDAVKNLDK